MKRRREIVSAMLCLLLAGTTLAAADPDRGRGDRKNDRGSKSEQKSNKEQSPKQGTVRRSEVVPQRPMPRATETRREPSRVVRELPMPRTSDRQVVGTRREPSRVVRERPMPRMSDRQVVGTRREPSVRERSMPRQLRTNDQVVSRTRTPAGWQSRALRGQAQYAAWDGHRAQRWGSEHRTWRARGGYHGYWIPDHRYRLVFGPRHRFRVDRCPVVIVSGYPRFYYSGYWVTFIDPWPEYWDDYWFAQDDCYVVYDDDGYYLTNVQYPGVRIAVSFTLG